MRTTHYQVGHPIYFGFLIHSCTSPVESKSKERVIHDIHKTLGNHKYQCSREAAKFLVRMAQNMGFLELNNIWTWKAFVIDYFEKLDEINRCHEKTKISSLTKRTVYLKYYLEADGAFLIRFAREVLENGENGLRKYTIRYTDKAVEPIFKDVINGYLTIEKDFRKRVQLRNFSDWVNVKGYEKKVRIHKGFPHLDPLVDLDILHYDDKERKYLPKFVENLNVSEIFLKNFPDIKSLEGIFLFEEGNSKKAGDYGVKCGYYKRVAELYDIPFHEYSRNDRKIISEEIEKAYSKVRDKVTGLASIRTIKDIVCTSVLVNHEVLCEWPDVDVVLKELKKEKGANLRFHVDRKGEIAYLVLSE